MRNIFSYHKKVNSTLFKSLQKKKEIIKKESNKEVEIEDFLTLTLERIWCKLEEHPLLFAPF